MQRLKKKLYRLGVAIKEIDKCISVDQLNKLKEKFEKSNGNSDGSNPEGK